MNLKVVSLTAVVAAALTAPAVAHHSFAMFDAQKTVTLQGTITAGDYVGISFSGEHYTYQLLGGDTIDSVAGAIVASIIGWWIVRNTPLWAH